MRLHALALAGLLAAPAALAAEPSLACTDFYEYVNGAWLKQAEIAPDRARVGSFDDLREATNQRLSKILSELKPGAATLDTPGNRLAVAYYASGMDAEAIERRAQASVEPLLAAIDALEAPARLPALLARLNRAGIEAPFGIGIAPDARDKRRYRLTLRQSGLGLPERDDYGRDDARTARTAPEQTFAAEGSSQAPSGSTLASLWATRREYHTNRRKLN